MNPQIVAAIFCLTLMNLWAIATACIPSPAKNIVPGGVLFNIAQNLLIVSLGVWAGWISHVALQAAQ